MYNHSGISFYHFFPKQLSNCTFKCKLEFLEKKAFILFISQLLTLYLLPDSLLFTPPIYLPPSPLPFSFEHVGPPWVFPRPWQIKSLQGQAYPLPLWPDKAAQLKEHFPHTDNSFGISRTPVVQDPQKLHFHEVVFLNW